MDQRTRPADSAADPLDGRLLDGRYRVRELIARGGMAAVYRGEDLRLDRVVAVKILSPVLADDPDFVARFHDEARAAARVSHPNVVSVYDQGIDDGPGGRVVFLVMAYIAGRTLRALLADLHRLTPAQALEVLEPVAAALAAAHAAGLVHRDVKPENIMLGDDGRVTVTDFGLARAVEAAPRTAGVLLGTVSYVSPEQVTSGRADARSDVYAAGCVLYEMLTGRPPHSAATPLAVAYQHVNADVPPPSATPGVSPALDALVADCTRRDPAERPASGEALLARVRAARAGTGAAAEPTRALPLPIPAPERPVPDRPAPPPAAAAAQPETAAPGSHATAMLPLRHRRRRWPAWLALLALVVAAAALGWYLLLGRYVGAPALTGLTLARAKAVATAEGLGVTQRPGVYSETVAVGEVVSQVPGPGGRVLRGHAVAVALSLGRLRYAVPALAGLSQADATAALRARHLQPGPVGSDFSDTVPAGRVISQDPAPGVAVRAATAVALTVSKGPQPVQVPDVTGQARDAAVQVLRSLGFATALAQAYSDTVPSGSVISTDPAAGATAGHASTVTLTVSQGPRMVAVPDEHGKTVAAAIADLAAQGFPKPQVDSFPAGPGLVLSQSPRAGTSVRAADAGTTTVTLFVF